MIKRLEAKDMQVGMHVWVAYYDHSYSGTRCSANVEPTEYIITEPSDHHPKGYKVKSKDKKGSYIPYGRCYASKEDAIEVYTKLVAQHVKAIFSKVSDVASIGAMSKRLQKYNMTDLLTEMNNIRDIADKVVIKINDRC